MKTLFEKFRALPLTVRMAIVFLTIIVIISVLAVPHITIPVLVIAGSVASLMRIFIYMVEERER